MKSLLFSFFLLSFFSWQTQAQTDEAVRLKHFHLNGRIAIQGYDPVAYFTDGKAEKGLPDVYEWYGGVQYFFASTAHRDAFKKNPSQYEPQYGGWCAYAMSKDGSKVDIDPKTFIVQNGKLYLFYNAYFTNTADYWRKDPGGMQVNADAHWKALYH